jgi:hypothetical protein
MPKRSTLVDDVLANLPRRHRRDFASGIPPDLLSELEVIRSDFLAGNIAATRTALAKAISRTLAARGIEYHPVTVSRWLDAN